MGGEGVILVKVGISINCTGVREIGDVVFSWFPSSGHRCRSLLCFFPKSGWGRREEPLDVHSQGVVIGIENSLNNRFSSPAA